MLTIRLLALFAMLAGIARPYDCAETPEPPVLPHKTAEREEWLRQELEDRRSKGIEMRGKSRAEMIADF